MTTERTWFPLTGPVTRARGPLAAARKKKSPIDPLTGPPLALAGRVVTMDDSFSVRTDAIVYVEKGTIVAVQDRATACSARFRRRPRRGDRRNNLSRADRTAQSSELQRASALVSGAEALRAPRPVAQPQGLPPADQRPDDGPRAVPGHRRSFPVPGTAGALCRMQVPAWRRHHQPGCDALQQCRHSALLPRHRSQRRAAPTNRICPKPKDASRTSTPRTRVSFLSRLKKEDSCFLLHLSEGVTDPAKPLSPARQALPCPRGRARRMGAQQRVYRHPCRWPAAAGLRGARAATAVRWSGRPSATCSSTAAPRAWTPPGAPASTIGLGSDWSPTGSKNLLGEMKVAWLYSQQALNGGLSARDIVAMATRDAARILKWERTLGSIEAGKRADLIVIDSTSADSYDALIRASETDLRLVMINGVARYGTADVMRQLAPSDQTVRVGGETRRFFLKQETADPDVARVSLSKASDTLEEALRDIGKLAKDLEKPKPARAARRLLDARVAPVWSLALDELFAERRSIGPAAAVCRTARFHRPRARAARVSQGSAAAFYDSQADRARPVDRGRRRRLPGADRRTAESSFTA